MIRGLFLILWMDIKPLKNYIIKRWFILTYYFFNGLLYITVIFYNFPVAGGCCIVNKTSNDMGVEIWRTNFWINFTNFWRNVLVAFSQMSFHMWDALWFTSILQDNNQYKRIAIILSRSPGIQGPFSFLKQNIWKLF